MDRAGYRAAFDGFDPRRVANYDDTKLSALLADAGIVRNRLKIRAAVRNAQALLALADEGTRFSDYVWSWTNGATIVNWYGASVGHDACKSSSVRWVEPLIPSELAAPVHPNKAGMAGAAAVLEAAIG